MNDKTSRIDNDVPAYKKKSKKKGLPRSKHKHIYETVLLCRNWHSNLGKPTTEQIFLPTKVCTICGRIDETDNDQSYYDITKVENLPFLCFNRHLSEKALSLPQWHTDDYFDKFAIKTEEDDDEI